MSFATKLKGAAIARYLDSTGVRRAWHGAARTLSRRPRTVTFWHRAGDPHSTLLAHRLGPLVADYGVLLQIVIVPEPAADVDPEPVKRAAYAMRDAVWLAHAYSVPFPDAPVDPNQDRLRRANAVLLVERPAAERLRVIREVGHALFSDDGDALAQAVSEFGCVPGQAVRPALEDGYARLRKAGHYQAGMLHYAGEWYWGLDRLPHLFERLKAEGLAGPSLPTPNIPPRLEVDVEMFFSFRSPYSYLALAQLQSDSPRIRLRPVLPMVMRGFVVPKAKVQYIARDAMREAKRLDVPFGKICDPVGEGVERALALFDAADALGRGYEFALRASTAIWSEAADLTDDATANRLAEEFGIASAAMADPAWRTSTEQNRAELLAMGLWGVPCFRAGDRVAWGQDRIAQIRSWSP